jgi:NADPH:quinone reductase-like Zn-dependent oxidoreductase
MHALRAHTRGGTEVLVYEQAPMPTVGDEDVLVEVHAAAITFAELTWEETWTRDGVDRTPTIPSHEFSGVVAGVGSGVTGWTIGDQIYGLIPFERDGAAAELTTAPASGMARKPASLSHVEAAALPLAALTAWQALVDHAKVTAGERVLIHGGAGGVGGYATQMAVALGAHATATSVGAVEYVKSLGAERVIDVRSEEFDTQTGVFDVVIDTVGGQTLHRSFAVLRKGGRLVTLQAPPDQQMASRFDVDAMFFIVTADGEELAKLARLADSGSLRVTVAETFPLAQGRAAYASGALPNRVPGKTVLTVRGDHTPD